MKNNSPANSVENIDKKIRWQDVQNSFKEKFGVEIYESWLKKIDFIEEYQNYIFYEKTTTIHCTASIYKYFCSSSI